MRATSRLSRTLSSGKRALTVECLPPIGTDPEATKRLASYFPPTVDAVVVADNHGEVRSSAVACAALLTREKTETLLSVVTRDRNRIALQSDVLGAASLGIHGFLCLTGVHQALGTSRQAAGAYDLDSCQLTQALSRLSDEGLGFSGSKLDPAPSLFVAAAAHPNLAPIELSLLGVKKKIAAGAQALFTDAVTDLAGFQRWMAAVCAAGFDKQVAIIASVRPDAITLAGSLNKIDGVRGIHLLSGGCEPRVSEFLQQGGLS
jgi:methylenetetrahydrofolate reductase (NADPH)